jgi:hypothetical protein
MLFMGVLTPRGLHQANLPFMAKSQPSHVSKDKCKNVETSHVNKPAPVKAKKTKEKPTKLVDLLDCLF